LIDGDNHDNFFEALKDFNLTVSKDKIISQKIVQELIGSYVLLDKPKFRNRIS